MRQYFSKKILYSTIMDRIVLLRIGSNKAHLGLTFILGLLLCSVQAQVVQSVGVLKNNTIPVFIVDFPEEADLFVCTVDSKKLAQGNQGLWYFQDSQTYADKKIFFVDKQELSKLQIYFIDEPSQAGWQNKAKKKLLE